MNMLGRVVITSVPRGLDGGAGFQTVLRTHGMQPSVAERLAGRAAYPHPFPFGDPRNPHVLFHRIERVGDRTTHILGSIRDAGGSFTGRSNHLAELIAIDSAETRGLPGGPGFAALEFPWLGRWTGEPRAVPLAEEIAIPAHDPSDPEATRLPARCTAWERATGDAGWAGELAQSFLDGRRALIWAGDAVNVLELFTEALRLLPASVRWQVTFNTCEIEPFPARWRAVRPELGLVGNYEPTNELRLVLGKIRESRSRAPDHALSRQARGEAPARENTSAPSRDRGNVSATSEDDAALRATLREISETRRRRTGPAVVARTATKAPGMQRWVLWAILPAVLALLGTGALVVRSSRMSPSDDKSPDGNLRSAREESERASRLAEARNRAAVPRVEQVKAEAQKAQAVAKSVTDAEQVQIDAKAQVEAERVKAESAKDQEKTARQNKALNSLQAAPVTKVTLVSSERYSEFSPEQPPVGQTITLCEAFDIANLISPKLMLATAYSGEEHGGREPMRVREITISGVPTWTITGMIHDDFQGTQIGDIDVGQIVAQDGKLVLKLLVGPKHRLIEMLRNAVLLITTRDALNDTEDKLRKQVYFSQPRLSSEIPNVTFQVFETSDKDFDETLAKQVKGIPSENLQWEIECVFQSGVVFAINSAITELPLRFPPTGGEPFLIEYRDIGDDDQLCTRQESIALTGTLSFEPKIMKNHYAGHLVSRHTKSPDEDRLKKKPMLDGFFSMDLLRDAENAKVRLKRKLESRDKELYDKLFDDFLGANTEDNVKDLVAYKKKHAQLDIAVKAVIKVPGEFYPNAQGAGRVRYEDQQEYDRKIDQRKTDLNALEDLEKLRESFENSPVWRMRHQEAIASFDEAFKTDGPFGPFTVRLKQFTANAWCGKNGPYPIQIVEPGPD
jgi:hypothetical protein